MVDTPIGTDLPTYTLVSGDVGATIYCRVTATNAVGSASANSNTVGPVTAIPSAGTTFDPAHTAADITLSGGDLTATNTTGTRGTTRSIASANSGKKYFEVLVTAVDNVAVNVLGIANAALTTDSFPGLTLDGFGMAFDGTIYLNGVSLGGTTLTIGAGDRVCVAIDFDTEHIWWRENGGMWNGPADADPNTPLSGYDFSGTNAGPYYASVSQVAAADACTVNFGATAYAHTPPAGYGNF